MPVTKSRTYLGDFEDSNNTTGFLFGDEDSHLEDTRTTPTAEAFNTIYRSQAYSQLVSYLAPTFFRSSESPRLLHPSPISLLLRRIGRSQGENDVSQLALAVKNCQGL